MVYVFLAEGFEEVEALTPVDVLRRAEIDVKTVGINSNIIRGSHKIPVITDLDINEIKPDDSIEMIILPGGMPGTLNLESNEKVIEFIDYCNDNEKYISAICAAPSILGHKRLLNGKKATCFPGFESELEGAEYTGESVVRDGRITTAKGAGVALEFALCLVSVLKGKDAADKLRASLQCK